MRKISTLGLYINLGSIFSAINLLTIRYTLYRMVFLKFSQREGSIRLPGKQQLTLFVFLVKCLGRRHPSSLICACAVDSGANFISHLWSAMELSEQETRRLSLSLSLSLFLKRLSSRRFQALPSEEISRLKEPYMLDNTER